MPRNGAGVYSLPAGYAATSNATATASQHNDPLEDIEADANAARPISAGGTGATSASAARTALVVPGKSASETIDGDWTVSGDWTISGDPAFTGSPDFSGVGNAATIRSDLGVQAAADRLNATALDFLATADASSDAAVEFTQLDDTKYDAYEIVLNNVIPATDDVHLYIRTSTDGGSSYDSGASAYGWEARGGGANVGNDQADNAIRLTDTGTANAVGSAAGEGGVSGRLFLPGPNLAKNTMISFELTIQNAAGNIIKVSGGGARLSAADVDAVQILFASGNIESGTITLYGLRNA